jgi:c-di-GMP phosphodiesterase
MARQPIYDRDLTVFAYELLFRRGGEDRAAGSIGQTESAEALTNAVVEIGLERLVGSSYAFVNVTPELLLSDLLHVLPAERVVLEILEYIEPSQEHEAAIKALAKAGYTIALDDFGPDSEQEPFVQYADIVKVDVMDGEPSQLRGTIAKLKAYDVKLLAEKVETNGMYKLCKRLGFDYFQGYFFAKPAILSDRGIPPNRAFLFRLLTALQDPNVQFERLEQIINMDVTLTFRLLRLINSASVGMSERIESISQSLMLLGIKRVTALTCLLAMSSVDDKPNELLTTAMVRAKMCESIAISLRQPTEKYFTTGLLSVLDALMDMSMAELVEQLPLCDEVRQALTEPEAGGQIGMALRCVVAFERGDWATVEQISHDMQQISDSYLGAIEWAAEAERSMAAAA